MKRVGLIVNPIAGMGGAVGLKGTDGQFRKALDLGAVPACPGKAARAVKSLIKQAGADQIMLTLLTPPGPMGENSAGKMGIPLEMINFPLGSRTTAQDTVTAAGKMIEAGVDLILFAGGDGTARDICSAIPDSIPVIGIPGGVKIHSPVFALNPEKAGALAASYLAGKISRVSEREVLDIDESAYRSGRVITRLYGFLNVPYEKESIQNRKSPSPLSDWAVQNQIAMDVIDEMQKDVVYLVGPGTTTRPILENLSREKSLLGVDILCNKKMICRDASEKQILKHIRNRQFKIVVTPIGGQGYLFGRGNHQFSPEIIQMAGIRNMIVIATPQKIAQLGTQCFLVDSGNPGLDRKLAGFIRVKTGYRQEMMVRII